MMTNLFSIFDPSTPNFMSMNWLSIPLVLLLISYPYWTNSSRHKSLLLNLTSFILTQLSPLMKKSELSLIIPIATMICILMNNLMGLLPYIFTASSHMSFTLALALPLWLGSLLYGWTASPSTMLAHLIPPGTPPALMPFMTLIESISTLIRPITLSIRLAANMVAGHLLLVLLNSAFIIANMYSIPVVFISALLLSILEMAVAFIQAYVFSVLLTLYSAEMI
uniref:ATP synthase subunit a n=1 Tax=Haploginglymus sp. JP-2016 TaxID=1867951 RepID=A0A330IWG5_9CRUS|nr:ATP6 [Haploginglymus sp. JP-2016]